MLSVTNFLISSHNTGTCLHFCKDWHTAPALIRDSFTEQNPHIMLKDSVIMQLSHLLKGYMTFRPLFVSLYNF